MRASVFAPLLALAALATPRPADACGPDFPVSLLSDRGEALASLPEGMFLDDVAHLVEPAHAYTYVAGDEGASDPAVRAAYLRGRDGAAVGAIAAYQRVRALVDAGANDGAGLALSSLGQEARLHLHDGDPVRALQLYAEQAALGHPDGATSLLFVTRDLVANDREREVLGDAVGQHVIAIYLATRGAELDEATATRLWDELAAIEHVAGAEQLATVAYQRGDWDRAAALAAEAGDAPRARWVAAKLALRAGDRVMADRLLALAADGFARGAERDRCIGERTTIAVGDGRMTDALALGWQTRTTYPLDLDYVAERLVDVDELRAFVDELPDDEEVPTEYDWWGTTSGSLSELLGRRLMRAGRYREAVPYFGAERRGLAVDLAVAMQGVAAARGRIDRARALFQASRIARVSGLEVLGTAHAPDWERYDAQYDVSAYIPPPWLDAGSPLELALAAANAPAHAERYHYRYLAADLAEQAAALVPARAQAHRAMLCWADRYRGMIHEACEAPDFEGARHLPPAWLSYHPRPRPSLVRRVGHAIFGRGPEARRHATMTAVAAAGGLALLGLGLLWRRRWRKFTPRP